MQRLGLTLDECRLVCAGLSNCDHFQYSNEATIHALYHKIAYVVQRNDPNTNVSKSCPDGYSAIVNESDCRKAQRHLPEFRW